MTDAIRPGYQQRVVDEQLELQGRLDRLAMFVTVAESHFKSLGFHEQYLLIRQLELMSGYNDVLKARIAYFDAQA